MKMNEDGYTIEVLERLIRKVTQERDDADAELFQLEQDLAVLEEQEDDEDVP